MKLPEVYQVQKVKNPKPIHVSVPGSKSITNRALLLAALAKGTSHISGVLFSDDSRHFLAALKELGVPVEICEEKRTVTIRGFGGRIPRADVPDVYVGSAGTAARFLAAFLGLSDGTFHMDASEQMRKRPMGELLRALKELGAEISYEGEPEHFPFTIGNRGWKKHDITVDIDKSSQFLSAVLISSVLSEEDFTIRVTGTHGMAYVEMTLAMMEQFGVSVRRQKDGSFVVPKEAAYTAREYEVEPDLSAACYFYAASPILKVPAKVYGVRQDCLQGDIRFLSVLSDMGCEVREEADGIVVLPPEDGLKGGCFDLSAFSDQALTLAALAPFAESAVEMKNIGHIRFQECDRIEAILVNLRAMGISCEEKEGNVVIEPTSPKPCLVKTFEDHRVAMAFALPGLAVEGIAIENPGCCRKTFEDYFEVLEEAVIKPGNVWVDNCEVYF